MVFPLAALPNLHCSLMQHEGSQQHKPSKAKKVQDGTIDLIMCMLTFLLRHHHSSIPCTWLSTCKEAHHIGGEEMSTTTTATTAICNNLNMLTSGSWNN
eukprot:scaffold6153_cov88-Skeletonema_marinoi.AAC.1